MTSRPRSRVELAREVERPLLCRPPRSRGRSTSPSVSALTAPMIAPWSSIGDRLGRAHARAISSENGRREIAITRAPASRRELRQERAEEADADDRHGLARLDARCARRCSSRSRAARRETAAPASAAGSVTTASASRDVVLGVARCTESSRDAVAAREAAHAVADRVDRRPSPRARAPRARSGTATIGPSQGGRFEAHTPQPSRRSRTCPGPGSGPGDVVDPNLAGPGDDRGPHGSARGSAAHRSIPREVMDPSRRP